MGCSDKVRIYIIGSVKVSIIRYMHIQAVYPR